MSDIVVNVPRSSLSAGSAIYSVLKDLLGEGHVRPVVSENEVTLPLVTFRRVDARSLDEKGRSGYDEVCYEVVVFAKTYGEGVETMERVRKQLMGRIVASEEEDGFAMTMDCVKLVGGEESWKDGAFVQTIRLSYHVALGLVKQKMTYEFKLVKSGAGTLMLPFDSAIPDGVRLFETDGYSVDDKAIYMKEAKEFKANTPYVVEGTPGLYTFEGFAGNYGGKYTKGFLTGSYIAGEKLPLDNYVLQTDGKWHPSGRPVFVTSNKYRCWITPPADLPKDFRTIFPDAPAPVKPKRTLTVRSANESQGSVSGGGIFDDGSTQTIQATPKAGFAFDKWSDGSTQNPRTVELTSDLTLTASFKTATTGGGDQGSGGDQGGTLGD